MTRDETDALDDRELLRRAKAGAVDLDAARRAYARLVARHGPTVVRAVERIVDSRADAEDVTQDAFLRVWVALDRCPDDVAFGAWARVVACRLGLNRVREARRRRAQADGEALAPPPPDDAVAETRDFARHLLESLPEAQREILLLRYVEELSVDEIGAALGIARSATKMRLARARDELGERIRRGLGG